MSQAIATQVCEFGVNFIHKKCASEINPYSKDVSFNKKQKEANLTSHKDETYIQKPNLTMWEESSEKSAMIFWNIFKLWKLLDFCCGFHISGETTAEIFEVNFISDRNKTDIGFYATFVITEMGGDGNQIVETVTEISDYVKGRMNQHTNM